MAWMQFRLFSLRCRKRTRICWLRAKIRTVRSLGSIDAVEECRSPRRLLTGHPTTSSRRLTSDYPLRKSKADIPLTTQICHAHAGGNPSPALPPIGRLTEGFSACAGMTVHEGSPRLKSSFLFAHPLIYPVGWTRTPPPDPPSHRRPPRSIAPTGPRPGSAAS